MDFKNVSKIECYTSKELSIKNTAILKCTIYHNNIQSYDATGQPSSTKNVATEIDVNKVNILYPTSSEKFDRITTWEFEDNSGECFIFSSSNMLTCSGIKRELSKIKQKIDEILHKEKYSGN